MDNLLGNGNDHLFLDPKRGDNTNSFIANVNLIATNFDVVLEMNEVVRGIDEKVASATKSATNAAKSAKEAEDTAARVKVLGDNIATSGTSYLNSIRNEGTKQLTAVIDASDTAITGLITEGNRQMFRASNEADRARQEADRAEHVVDSLPGFINAAGQRTFVGLFMNPVTTEILVTIADDGDILNVKDFFSLDILPRESRYYINNNNLMLELPFTL